MRLLPLARRDLERFRLAAGKRTQAGQVGAHLVRRRGQSLEFRDHAAYTPGDDVRHVDWRASARAGRPGELLVRRFQAEETLRLVISIDSRPTMALPEREPKIQLACWLAYALTWIGNAAGDRVYLHGLFAPSAGVQELRGGGVDRAERFLDQLTAQPCDAGAECRLGAMERLLRPASIWVLVTDLYFDDPGDRLARILGRAQERFCWVLLVELDTWPHERALLGRGAHRIDDPSGTARHDVEIDPAGVRAVEQGIEEHRRRFLDRTRRTGLDLTRWRWPAGPNTDLAAIFRQNFKNDRKLRRIFRRSG